ncbi:MAG: type 2 isopentenyl-diphosphate Delta-isomerase [Candidatus Methanofastidiosa archaeon]|nr:type 2 isopentenyl-diphosphate Delta-isomerase [Candidatus Methanofastidiosa archaeon]
MTIPERKDDHIRFSLEHDVQCTVPAGFDDVTFIHTSLPELSYDELDTSAMLFGKRLSFPFMISALTGGSPTAERINARLARLAQETGIAVSVGSQRAMLEDGSLRPTFEMRAYAPDALLFANIGIAQLIHMGNDAVHGLVDAIGADVLAVHLNPLQEVVQPEGDTDFRGGIARLRDLSDDASYPVIVKETGAGISAEVAEKVSFLDGVDVSGVGGTSFAAVEYHRAAEPAARASARTFWDWGIPTVPSIIEVAEHFETIIASGGVRNGLHVAKALALGARCAGLALPFLEAVQNQGPGGAEALLAQLSRELRMAMLLTGSRDLEALSHRSVIISGSTRTFITDRGFSTEYYARKEEFT